MSLSIVDGSGVGDVGAVVLNDRKILAEDGMVVIMLPMSSHDHQLLCDPEIVTRGFVYVKESEQLLQELRELAQDAVSGMSARRRKDDGEVCKTVRSAVSSYLYKHTKRSPMIIPMVTRHKKITQKGGALLCEKVSLRSAPRLAVGQPRALTPHKVFFAAYTPQKTIRSYSRRCGAANSVRQENLTGNGESISGQVFSFSCGNAGAEVPRVGRLVRPSISRGGSLPTPIYNILFYKSI